MNPIIGTTVKSRKVQKVRLDPAALLSTHMAVVASSGGGKSWLVRLILEQTFGLFPHLVIDVEGELKTLREKYDYIIASADDEGDCIAHPRTAKLLARRLLELNASCIIDIYELNPDAKVTFVKEFVSSLVNAPKSLWGQRLVVIDEAHQFVPQNNERGMASRAAVIDLLSRGRKRGLSTILASQRLSKVSKDALGECRNKLYGFCNLLADRKRATEDLGFLSKADQEKFRQLDVGHFYAVGPAISKKEVVEVKVGKVKTTHPRPGEGIQAHTPPPKAKVKKLLKELSDLPEQAKKEAHTLEEAKKEVSRLQGELRRAGQGQGGATTQEVTAARSEGFSEGHSAASEQFEKVLGKINEDIELSNGGYKLILDNISNVTDAIREQLKSLKDTTKHVQRTAWIDKPGKVSKRPYRAKVSRQISGPAMKVAGRAKPTVEYVRKTAIVHTPNSSGSGNYSEITGGCRRLVEVLVRCHPARFTKSQWAALAKLKHTSGTFGTYLSKLRTSGLIIEDGGLFGPSAEAFDWLQEYVGHTHPQSNEEIVEMWKNALGGTPARMIQVLRECHPDGISREEIGEEVGVTHTSGTFGTYLSKLRSNRLVEVHGQVLFAGEPLLWEPGR
jgi:hypothetical protein